MRAGNGARRNRQQSPFQVVVGLPYGFAGQMTLDEITGASPYGASTIVGGKSERQPSWNELDGARHQGELVAKTAAKLFA